MLTFFRNEFLEQPVGMKKSLLVILAFALFSSGCSTAMLAYRNADWYLQHKINGYTTFNAAQKVTIRQQVSDYMQWHRKEALPEYIIFLQNLNGTAQTDGRLTAEQIALLRAHLMNLYKKTLEPAIRPTAQLLSSLDNRQIQELGRTFAEQNQKLKKEVLNSSHDDILNKRADETLSFLDWLAGKLSKEQTQKIREMSRRLPLASEIYMQHREANQGRLIALLNEHAGAERIAAFLSSWILTPEATRTSQQQRVIQAFETGSDEMIVQIHGLLTAKQKAHMHKTISSLIDDMKGLATDMRAQAAHP
ncbi:MAG: DUF6279 family lipoprotein [Gallionella sp.]